MLMGVGREVFRILRNVSVSSLGQTLEIYSPPVLVYGGANPISFAAKCRHPTIFLQPRKPKLPGEAAREIPGRGRSPIYQPQR